MTTKLDKQIPINTQEEANKEFELKYFKLDTSKLVSLMKKDLTSTTEGTAFLANHKKEDVMRYLQSPIASEKILRQISSLLYNLSPQYKRLLHYFADMARYDYVIDINNTRLLELPKEDVLKKYLKATKYIDIMNIKHEFSKITKTIFIEDVFYGYTYSTDHSYFIQKLDPDYCKLNGWADGVRTFVFDFSYFNGKRKELLDTQYANEFKERYEKYKENAKDFRWQELSLENSICIKLNEELDYVIPFFAAIFPDIFDLQDYKLLKKAKEELQNFVILVAKIPYLKDAGVANNFSLLMDDAIAFGNKAMQQLPDQCGFILSPYEEVTDIHLGSKNQVDSNSVADAEKYFWDSAGVNQAIFNSDKVTEESIRKSIVSDEGLIFSLYKQYSRWINRKVKLSLNDDFKARLLDTTTFNYLEYTKRLKEMAMYGIPVKREIYASLGGSPLEMQSAISMENNILGLQDVLKPLISSNTQSGKDNGRPPQDATGGDSTGKKIAQE